MVQAKEQNKEYNKEYYLKNREQARERQKEYRLKNREHVLEQQKKYYLKNRGHILEYQKIYDNNRYKTDIYRLAKKEYYLKNRERRIEYQKEHQLKNKERIKEKKKEYNSRPEKKELRRKNVNNRYQTNVNFKLLTLCRARLLAALKGESKSASTMELIGCTMEELRKHIESKFEPWMNWENHGLWDVDHIIACAKFDMSDPEQQRACFNWSNLQPMEHIANIKKGAR